MSLFRREDLHSLAAPYALDALEPAERARFERHLKDCDSCAAEVRALSEDAVRLAWSAAAPPPSALRDRVLAAVRTTPQESAVRPEPARARPEPARARRSQLPPHVWGAQPPPRQRPRRPLFVPFATATAAAALVVASLFAVQADRTQDELDAQKAQASEIAHVLQAADALATRGQDAQGRTIGVIASASEGRAVVTLSGYDPPPSGRVRQLWLMRPDEQPRSLGLFAADTPLVASGLDKSATSLAVTVEPDGGSPQPTTQPVVQLALKSVGFGE
ncbi:anti-sigma-K factor RskA [Streptomyces sp. SAI-117]|uniref:anti-sigma factor n=1 Tax=Streptomyces sp. SAI-117 TaxID=2940546 RepID=UPI0024769361|nr:anti-sigma factor [Streptomyces sp. SAI-117]MDH6571468.1 anti-sigma-K factor RskA [Streptomyces sp. SAI-117]